MTRGQDHRDVLNKGEKGAQVEEKRRILHVSGKRWQEQRSRDRRKQDA